MLVTGPQGDPRERGRGLVSQAGRTTTGLRTDDTRFSARPTSLAHLRRRASEKKWPEARSWCERRRLNKGYVLRKKGKPGLTPARAEKRTAARFYVPAQVRACLVMGTGRDGTGQSKIPSRPVLGLTVP